MQKSPLLGLFCYNDGMTARQKHKWNIGIALISLVGTFILFTIAEKAGAPNYDLPFGWNKFTYDNCSGADYQAATKHCKEICPQIFSPNTRGNGFPFTVDYSDCDSAGGRANALAAPLNLTVIIVVSLVLSWLVTRRRRVPN